MRKNKINNMDFFLIIDTALEQGIVLLTDEYHIIGAEYCTEDYQHAAWLHPAIDRLLKNNKVPVSSISAFAVTEGPGSYTGLRIGLSTAKGLCYVLQKPLILLNNLQVFAMANSGEPIDFYIPMIDARRMEVYTRTYNKNFTALTKTHALVLNNESFHQEITTGKTMFCGTGALKFSKMVQHENALFNFNKYPDNLLFKLTIKAFKEKIFADPAYSVPEYGKNFYNPTV
jgi:tRNA threonylcarbamoyladenosine biosynthesis protein TsaB